MELRMLKKIMRVFVVQYLFDLRIGRRFSAPPHFLIIVPDRPESVSVLAEKKINFSSANQNRSGIVFDLIATDALPPIPFFLALLNSGHGHPGPGI
jgi:hypothetical protein